MKQKTFNFERGGSVASGSQIDNSILVGAPDSIKHVLTHRVLGTSRLGQIMPVDVIHTLPNSSLHIDLRHSAQFQPMPRPILDNLITKLHSYHISYNKLFGNWFALFQTGGKLGNQTFTLPYIDMTSINFGGRHDGLILVKIAILSWALSHHCTCKDVSEWLINGGSGTYDGNRMKILLETVYGKGSLLDMFNLGVPRFVYRASHSQQDTVEVYDFPTMIPIAPLLAYQSIINDRYRLDDYTFDYFYEDHLGDTMRKLEIGLSSSGTGYINGDSVTDSSYANLISDDKMRFGALFRNLDTFTMPDDNTSRDVIANGTDFHVQLSDLSVVGDPWDLSGLGTRLNFTPAAYMLAWLLSMGAIPYEKDYFTSILPRTQRGVVESIGSSGPSITDSLYPSVTYVKSPSQQNGHVLAYGVHQPNGQMYDGDMYGLCEVGQGNRIDFQHTTSKNALGYDYLQITPPQFNNAVSGGSVDANTMRYIFMATKRAEKMNLVGSDYNNQLLAEFGITSNDVNDGKPTYLGGLKVVANVDKVVATSDTAQNDYRDGAVLGDYSGDASQFEKGQFSFTSNDFGLIITVQMTYPQTTYAGWIDRNMFKVFDKTTWFTKEFEDLTEQHLYKQELKGTDTLRLAKLMSANISPEGSDVLGYIPRYNEYRSIPSVVHGEMIPSRGDTSNVLWTLARDFNRQPLSEQTLLYNSVENEENSRVFYFNNVDYPCMSFENRIEVSDVNKVGDITLPISL